MVAGQCEHRLERDRGGEDEERPANKSPGAPFGVLAAMLVPNEKPPADGESGRDFEVRVGAERQKRDAPRFDTADDRDDALGQVVEGRYRDQYERGPGERAQCRTLHSSIVPDRGRGRDSRRLTATRQLATLRPLRGWLHGR